MISIVLPAYNEQYDRLLELATEISHVFKTLPDTQHELIIVDDGSSPCIQEFKGATIIRHPYNIGNGAAIKTGARHAKGDIIIFMDADGQHSPDDIPKLLEKLDSGYDMAIGARTRKSQANTGRLIANTIYNLLAGLMVGQPVLDLTSGFRAVRANKFREFLYLLPNGFSYPTTITMAFFRAGYKISYLPINAARRKGKSHIHPLKDGIRFLLIIFRVGTLYSPLKLFLPISLLHFGIGLSYYAYTYINYGRFTNMSALLFIASMLVFLIGLVSEQITMLIYKQSDK